MPAHSFFSVNCARNTRSIRETIVNKAKYILIFLHNVIELIEFAFKVCTKMFGLFIFYSRCVVLYISFFDDA